MSSFDPQKFTWLGSLSAYTNDAYLLTVIARHPAKTIDDVNKPGMAVNLGTDRAGATNVVVLADRQGGARPAGQSGARLSGRGADLPRHAARRGRRPGDRAVVRSRPASARCGTARSCGRCCNSAGSRACLNCPTCRPAAKSPRTRRPRRCWSSPRCRSSWRCRSRRRRMSRPNAPGRCNRPSWRCAGTRASSRKPRSSDSTSARSTAMKSSSLLTRAAATPKDVIDRFNEIEKK